MKVDIVHKTARTVVIEILDDDIYETEAYEIWLDETLIREERKMVTVINGLKPGTHYKLSLKRSFKEEAFINFKTEEEFVTLNVRKFGAKGDGIHDDTVAIQTAIMCCPPKSRVYIPKGEYKIRNLFLKSHLILELGKDALLSAFGEREEFPILPGIIESYDENCEYNLGSWEGNPLDSMASIINGIHVSNVVICGEGTIDGGGNFDKWWVSEINRRYLPRPRMIFLNHCHNIVIQGIKIQNSPSWNIHPYFSKDIKLLGITIISPDKSHNTDGINPESCENVEIVGVHFSVGDDCIALKSGKIYMGKKYKTPSKNIYIRQCLMERGHGAVTIGSEIAGGVKDLLVSHCIFSHTDRGVRIKTRRGRGKDSIVDKVRFKYIIMEEVKSPIVVNCFYYCDPDGKSNYVATQKMLSVDERTPEIKNLEFSHILCKNAHYTGICIYGLPEKKVESILMNDVNITYNSKAGAGRAAMMTECEPTCRQGIFARSVKKMILTNVCLKGEMEDYNIESVEECIINPEKKEDSFD